MKFLKNLTAAALVTCIAATAAFAVPGASPSPSPEAGKTRQHNSEDAVRPEKGLKEKGIKEKDMKEKSPKGKDFKGKDFRHRMNGAERQDPVKTLEGLKEKVQEKVRNGEITEDKAKAIIEKIDDRIRKIKEFDKLTLQEKKDKLTGDFKAFIEKKVKEGRIPRDKADEMIGKFSERIKNWDGKGYPMFREKGLRQHKGDPAESKE